MLMREAGTYGLFGLVLAVGLLVLALLSRHAVRNGEREGDLGGKTDDDTPLV
jgi:hypothetical protein